MTSSRKIDLPERLALIRWAARIGPVTAEAAAEHEEVSLASARGRLLAAERLGLLAGCRPLADQPRLFTVTRAGLRLSGTAGLRPARVSATCARHAVACAGVAAALEKAYPSYRLIGEPEIRREQSRREASAFLSAELPGGAGLGRLHRPDLGLCPAYAGGPAPIAVEVELTVKAPRRLVDICVAWARCRAVSGVLYLATAEVDQPLRRAIERARAAHRISVIPLELGAAGEIALGGAPREPSQSVRNFAGGGSTI